MRYDRGFIEQVREANDLVEIIGQYTNLKGRGDQHMGLCPFPDHKEKTPSFSVSATKQLYHCFGCKKAGNVYKFLETFNGFSFPESVEYLARRASIELPKTKGNKEQWDKDLRQKSLFSKINKQTAVYFYKQRQTLSADHKVNIFMAERGLSPELADDFRLGYATEEWDGLLKEMSQRKVPVSALEKLGLIRKNKRGGFFDLFRDRLIYPIFSLNNDVVGFGGRILGDGHPKYLNSVESPVFKKGQIFYGLHRSMHEIRNLNQAIVVEGYMDYLALYGAGIKNVVATLGTALTESHVRLLKRWTKNIVLLFDGDQAGQVAAERSLPHFFTHGLSPRVYSLGDGKDPDDFVKEVGGDAFKELLSGAQDLFLSLLKGWTQGYSGTPVEKIRVFDRAAPLLASLGDGRLADLYLDALAQELDEDPARMRSWLKKMGGHSSSQGRFGQSRAGQNGPGQSQSGQRAGADSSPGPQRGRQSGSHKGQKWGPAGGNPSDPGRGFESSSTESLGGMDNSEEFQKLRVSEAPMDEKLLVGLAIFSKKALDLFRKEGMEAYISHPALRSLYLELSEIYGQDADGFVKLSHLVIERVENPENILNLVNFSSDLEGDQKEITMASGCVIRLKDRYLAHKSAELTRDLKKAPSQEKLEQIMNIQKERLSLKRHKKEIQGVD